MRRCRDFEPLNREWGGHGCSESLGARGARGGVSSGRLLEVSDPKSGGVGRPGRPVSLLKYTP